MLSLETSKNIQKISFIFFIIIGALHLLSGLAVVKGYYPDSAYIINRVLLIPFVLSALSYFFASLKAALLRYNKKSSFPDYLFIAITVLVFVGLLLIEFIFADK